MNEQPLICLMGPTASGKSALSLALADHFPIEIINVDSAIVYQGLKIGAGQPTASDCQKVPHHLVGSCPPTEVYSAHQFVKDAKACIQSIRQRDHIPVLVGGTMLYYNALLFGLNDVPKSDASTRQYVSQQRTLKGPDGMFEWLKSLDALSANKLHLNDQQRVDRAIEVSLISGKPYSDYLHKQGLYEEVKYPHHAFAIWPEDREALHALIQQRFLNMLADGLIEEVKQLREHYPSLSLEAPAMRAVGYRQVWHYLDGDCTYDEMIDHSVAATRQLAKRQFTWLRRWPNLHRLPMDFNQSHQMVRQFLQKAGYSLK